MMVYLKKTGLFMIATILLALTAVFFISATVLSESRIPERAQARYHKELGQEYVKAVRCCLTDLGYQNSGVTLSRTTETDDTMTYTVTIHHSRIDRLTDKEQEDLKLQLADIPAPREINTVYHEFLVLND